MTKALVTGATSGLGREFCWQLAETGHDLILVARDKDRLRVTAEQIRKVAQVDTQIISADLGDADQLESVCRAARTVDVLVNNAGFGLGKPFLDNSLAAESHALDVMVKAVMATCHSAGQAMRQRQMGSIVNVSSVAADTGMGTYSAHKAWVRAFTEGLAEELRGSGVTATVVLPGLVRTEFHDRMGSEMEGVPDFAWLTVAEVVSKALNAVERGQVICTPTVLYKALGGVSRVAPRSLVRAITRRLPHT